LFNAAVISSNAVGTIISSAENIKAGHEIEVILRDAKLKSIVKEKIQYDGTENDL
jgi:exodeoxyribonuclease VII large subunit